MEDRFWAKVDFIPFHECWEWGGALSKRGYGNFMVRAGKTDGAHRVAYELLVGPIPEGLHLDHLCRNRACVRPEHLEPVTCGENLRRGSRATATHCPQGHPYSGSNLYVRPDRPGRDCKECKRDAVTRSRKNRRSNA